MSAVTWKGWVNGLDPQIRAVQDGCKTDSGQGLIFDTRNGAGWI